MRALKLVGAVLAVLVALPFLALGIVLSTVAPWWMTAAAVVMVVLLAAWLLLRSKGRSAVVGHEGLNLRASKEGLL